jgi:multimeric flavodoxin WrbA
MKILGLNGSERKLGNTEILVKEALMGAEEEGVQVEMLRQSSPDGLCHVG